ncbi:hypothetical protein [Streptomyces mirabilis]|uniref:hypothetical protein n=1 Tax=Streptomyces mirabilis TaxID=68239 RepID=UPI0033B735F4
MTDTASADGDPVPGRASAQVARMTRRGTRRIVATAPLCLLPAHQWCADLTQQARTAVKGGESQSADSTVSRRTDLEVLRADNQRLRGQVSDLKGALQRQLGRQLDQLQATDLTDRIGELTAQNQELHSHLTQLQHENQELERRLAETNDDLVAARASLRRMIRVESS